LHPLVAFRANIFASHGFRMVSMPGNFTCPNNLQLCKRCNH